MKNFDINDCGLVQNETNDLETLMDAQLTAFVKISQSGKSGSGTFIADNRILTASHVTNALDVAKTIKITLGDGNFFLQIGASFFKKKLLNVTFLL